MSETYNTITDPSTAEMPEWLSTAYTDINNSIANQYEVWPGSLYQQEHLTRSRTGILDTATTALRQTPAGEERNAVILGAGGCFDIPLEELATQFDHITLVDIDTAQTEVALSMLPAKVLGKITLQKCDVSGSITELGRIIEDNRSATYETFIARTAASINAIAKQPQADTVTGEYSFVCSQLLMSQLGSVPALRLVGLVNEIYGTPLSLRPGGQEEPLVYALNEHAMTSHINHAKQLGKLTKPAGTAHFADTILEESAGQKLPMMSHAPLDEMDKHFDNLSDPQLWQWSPDTRRLFWVLSRSLARKP